MLTNEVRDLVERFEKNADEITSLHRLIVALEKKYCNFWNEVWKECEEGQHDTQIIEKEKAEYNKLCHQKSNGELTNSADVLRYSQLRQKYESGKYEGGRSYHCSFCGKKLRQGHSFWEDSFPQKIYMTESLKRWLLIKPHEWPEEKRELLAKIQRGICEYIVFAEPMQECMRELSDEQIAYRAQIDEIVRLCDEALNRLKSK